MSLIRPLSVAFAISLSLSTTVAYAANSHISASDLPVLKQEGQHAEEAQRIAAIYTRSHYVDVILNDGLSRKIFKRYLNQLDYHHDLFLSSDMNMMADYRTQLDDDLVTGQLAPFYKMFNVSLKRRYQKFVYSLSLLDEKKPLKFSNKERYQFDRSEAGFPKTKEQQQKLWRKRVEFDALNLKLAGKKWPEIVKLLTKRYQYAMKRLTQSESEDVFQTAMNAFSRSIDPHTSYLSPRSSDRFNTEMSLSLQGIGAVLESKDEYTTIRSLIPGGPAAKSGKLKPGDRIVGVGQEGKPVVDVIGWRIDDVVDLIKGPKGTTVYLQILPANSKIDGKTHRINLSRDTVHLKDRAANGKVMTIDHHKVGILNVPSFYVGLSRDSAKAIKKLMKQQVSSLVIDLRGNGGGALSEAIGMTALFIPRGPVVQVRDSMGRVRVSQDTSGVTLYDGPLIVLVDQYSASASEILSAALQDYNRAVIVGVQTYGKGTVQQHRGLDRNYDSYAKPMGHVQYTMAKFYRINGGSTQRKGVLPDILFPSAQPHSKIGESSNKNALPWDRIAPASYKPLGNFKQVLPKLIADHQQRIKHSSEFQYIVQDINQYKARKDKKSVSLNYNERKAAHDKRDAKELKRLNARLKIMGKKPVKSLDDVPDDFKTPDAYLHEAASIAEDLAEREQKN